MNFFFKYFNNKIFILIFFISFLLFIFKWLFSFYYFQEDILLRVFNDSELDSFAYFPFVKITADINFFENFTRELINLKTMIVPLGAILPSAIFYLIFKSWSFILIEFFSILLFVLIFFKLFKLFRFSDLLSIFLSIFIFSLYKLISLIGLGNYQYFSNLDYVYNLRFPRPQIAHLYYYFFILYLLSLEKFFFRFKEAIILSILFCLTFTSFFNLFLVSILTLALFLFSKIKIIYNHKLKFLIFIINLSFFFILFSLPFFYLYFFTESDFLSRWGLIKIDYNQKFFLLSYYFEKFTKLKFLFAFLITTLFYLLLNKKKKQEAYKLLILYLFFIASILSPIFLIIFSNKIHHLYHYDNIIFINLFLVNFIYLIILLKSYIEKIFHFFQFYLIFLSIFFYNVSFISSHNLFFNKNFIEDRIDLNNAINALSITKIPYYKEKLILSFDGKFLNYLIFNNSQNFMLLPAIISTRTNSLQEYNIIESLKFINFKHSDFLFFFKNEFENGRFQNKDVQSLFMHRYQANSLSTYNGSSDFNNFEKSIIKLSSPLNVHQSVIPNYELQRLSKIFLSSKTKTSKKPDIVIIYLKNIKFKNYSLSMSEYCKIYSTNFRVIYIKRNLTQKCI